VSLTDCQPPTSRDTGCRRQLTFVSDVPSKASSGAGDLALAGANGSLQAHDRCVRLPEGGKEPAHQHGILFGRLKGSNRVERLEPGIAGALESAARWIAAQIHTPPRLLHGRARIAGACGEVILGRAVKGSRVRDHSQEHEQDYGPDREPAPVRAGRSQGAFEHSGGQGLGRGHVFMLRGGINGRSRLGGSDLIRLQGWQHDRLRGSPVRLDLKRGPSDPDLVTGAHGDGPSDPFTLDEGAVGRIEVFYDHRFARAS